MENGLVDYPPNNSTMIEKLGSASNVILIDNYDSFTWNIYQYLALEGASVTVYRNDQITLEELIAKKPTQLVISPGPGHPDTDAGISKAAIKEFSGKIPVFGVCLGHQCMISVFGGKIDVAGEILHGKTSVLNHDGKGVYDGLPPSLDVGRYHSLAGTHSTLPDSLEVSSLTNLEQDAKPIIMGCRHKGGLLGPSCFERDRETNIAVQSSQPRECSFTQKASLPNMDERCFAISLN
ncbi:hypothetical protein EIK77_005967 [Talaromyces pinophilus]|nr:hypothetical protein EIK77_005967 [Talaromyces pinophilus]